MSVSMSGLFLLLMISILFIANGDSNENSALLMVKTQLGNPDVLQSWNSSTPHCKWTGIGCSDGFVDRLDLSERKINASFPEAIGDLKNLTYLNLAYNNLEGGFPKAVYNCRRLQYLNLSQNLFGGVLPDDIATLSSLHLMDVGANNFEGSVPPTIGKMIELRTLQLYLNNFNGSIPKEIGNLYNLETLGLAWNEFSSEIPTEFGNLRKLTYLWMAASNLVGTIPASFGNLSSMEQLDLSRNILEGKLPDTLFTLKNLTLVYLFHNNLSGEIPQRIESMNLKEIDLSRNNLTGQIPIGFGSLKQLQIVNLQNNKLSGEVPTSLGLLPSLTVFRVFSNNLKGRLPPEMGLHSNLGKFEVSENHFTGELPQNLCAGGALTGVSANTNSLSGNIPQSLGNCPTLSTIQLSGNNMSGEIPEGVWTCPGLQQLTLNGNSFTGSLPSTLGSSLSRIEINDNMFSGPIPGMLSAGKNLTVFIASNNQLSGELPTTVTASSSLQVLKLDGNHLSGKLPSRITSWKNLNTLYLSGNNLSGKIPAGLGLLPVLNYLDLSRNHLSGSIPTQLNNLKPSFLNLSSNRLSGKIPESFDNLGYATSFQGNLKLCTNNPNLHNRPNLPQCKFKKISSKYVVIIVLALAVVLIAGIVTVLSIRNHQRKKSQRERIIWKVTSFQRLNFTEETILRNLEDNNVIGSGGSGKVYRVPLLADEYVAVKRIRTCRRLDAKLEKEFAAEVQILGDLKHANIIKLLCCISSEDSKLLVYEYMENSSLDRWLQARKTMTALWPNVAQGSILDWSTRMQIAVGAAHGLCYMHHCCPKPIIHRDIKSSNILLDSEFKARIADFGVAEMLAKEGEAHTISTVAGSYGYIAPEYGYARKVNEKVDVYSFGVVLLELVTGREARDGGDNMSLAEWSWKQFSGGIVIADCFDEEIKKQSNFEEMTIVFKLGLRCTSILPSSRPSMKEVLDVLKRCQQLSPRKKNSENEMDITPLL